MATYLENLIAAKDRYAAQLAAQEAPPNYRWNEYEEFLVAQIERLNRMIAEARAEALADQTEVISGGFT